MCSGDPSPCGASCSTMAIRPPVLAPLALMLAKPPRNQRCSPSPGCRAIGATFMVRFPDLVGETNSIGWGALAPDGDPGNPGAGLSIYLPPTGGTSMTVAGSCHCRATQFTIAK